MKWTPLFLIIVLTSLLMGCGKAPKSASGGAFIASGAAPLSKSAADFGYSRADFGLCTYATAVLYRADLNICVFAQDGCEIQFLRERGFGVAPQGLCEQAVPSEASEYSWMELDSSPSVGQVCTLNFKIMKNSALRICLQAQNGCAISYAQSLGFTEDRDGVCDLVQQ